MSLALVFSRPLAGPDAPLVHVEAHPGGGLPQFHIVGLAETEVKEARDRVRAALSNARFDFPAGRVTVNLAPADLPKESGRFDLPIAIGILAATGQIPSRGLDQFEFAGELALSGELRPIRGALAMTFGAHRDGRAFVIPESAAGRTSLARGARILPARSLLEVCAHLTGIAPLSEYRRKGASVEPVYADLADVYGQALPRRALEIAAAGAPSPPFPRPPRPRKTMLPTPTPAVLPARSEDRTV